MKFPTLLYGALLLPLTSFAEKKATLIFEDDFERSESDDSKEEIGNGWSSNSEKRAQGNKQVDLKDGALHITFHPVADHAVSVVHPAEFQNGKVTLRFMLLKKEDSLKINFADLQFKEVHAGHLCAATISTTKLQIDDLKTGRMKKEMREASKNKTLTKEQKKLILSKKKTIPNDVAPGKWHDLEITIVGGTMTVSIDGKETGSFTSEGIAHPTKRTLRVGVPKKAIIDDLKIYSLIK